MIGLVILIVAVVAALVAAAAGAARRAAAAARLRRAAQALRAALGEEGGPEAIAERMRGLARRVPGLGAAEAGALVLGCRQTFSRKVVPVLVAALAHPAAAVSRDAALALNDLGSPGLRAVWQAVDGGSRAPAHVRFLLEHPDWLFERLLEACAGGEADAVARHEALWRDSGMLGRLQLLRSGSDAINRMRAEHISALLSAVGTRRSA